MPRSKSKRSSYTPPKPAKPPPSPRWVPIVGLSVIGIGVAVIIFSYILPGVLPGGNYVLIAGFVMMTLGLLLLSQWR